MNKKGLFAVLFLAATLLAPAIAATSAHVQQSNILASAGPDQDERELHHHEDGNVTTIDSEHEDSLSIEFSIEDGISLKVKYSSTVNATETELELETRFRELVEFVDSNQNGLFDPAEAVQTEDLRDISYSTPNVLNITSSTGVPGYRIESHSIGQTYTFQIIAYIYEKSVTANNTALTPTDLKITIAISDFPYAQGNSGLALLISAESELEVETESVTQHQGDSEHEVEVHSTTTIGYFSWSDSASVDGTMKPVNSTVTATAEGALITLAYPHGTTIVHDPILGVGAVSVPPANWIPIIVGVALAAGVAALLLVVVIRRARPRIQNSKTT